MNNKEFDILYKNKFEEQFKYSQLAPHDSCFLEFFKAAFEAGKQSVLLPSGTPVDTSNDSQVEQQIVADLALCRAMLDEMTDKPSEGGGGHAQVLEATKLDVGYYECKPKAHKKEES